MTRLKAATNVSQQPEPRASQPTNSANALVDIARRDVAGVLQLFDTSPAGLSEDEAKRRLEKSGLNEIEREKPIAWYIQLLRTVTNPLSLLLIVLAIVSFLTGSFVSGCIILAMVLFGGLLRFSQEFQGI